MLEQIYLKLEVFYQKSYAPSHFVLSLRWEHVPTQFVQYIYVHRLWLGLTLLDVYSTLFYCADILIIVHL